MKEFPQSAIEITGAPCSGKTTFIKKSFADKTVLLGGVPLSYGKIQRFIYSLFLSFYAIITRSISLRQVLWLVKKSAIYDETLFARLNAFRNCIMKFGYIFFNNNNYEPILIDEGISHIPFVLGLEDKDMDIFIILFRRQLENAEINFIQPPLKEILTKRIIERGHKRVRKITDAESFIERNIGVSENYKRALLASGLDVTVILK